MVTLRTYLFSASLYSFKNSCLSCVLLAFYNPLQFAFSKKNLILTVCLRVITAYYVVLFVVNCSLISTSDSTVAWSLFAIGQSFIIFSITLGSLLNTRSNHDALSSFLNIMWSLVFCVSTWSIASCWSLAPHDSSVPCVCQPSHSTSLQLKSFSYPLLTLNPSSSLSYNIIIMHHSNNKWFINDYSW